MSLYISKNKTKHRITVGVSSRKLYFGMDERNKVVHLFNVLFPLMWYKRRDTASYVFFYRDPLMNALDFFRVSHKNLPVCSCDLSFSISYFTSFNWSWLSRVFNNSSKSIAPPYWNNPHSLYRLSDELQIYYIGQMKVGMGWDLGHSSLLEDNG